MINAMSVLSPKLERAVEGCNSVVACLLSIAGSLAPLPAPPPPSMKERERQTDRGPCVCHYQRAQSGGDWRLPLLHRGL